MRMLVWLTSFSTSTTRGPRANCTGGMGRSPGGHFPQPRNSRSRRASISRSEKSPETPSTRLSGQKMRCCVQRNRSGAKPAISCGVTCVRPSGWSPISTWFQARPSTEPGVSLRRRHCSPCCAAMRRTRDVSLRGLRIRSNPRSSSWSVYFDSPENDAVLVSFPVERNTVSA